MDPKSNKTLSNVVWALAIGAVALVDITQIILNLFAVGLIANRYIDIVVALAILLGCKLAGITLTKERLLSIVAVFFGEQIPLLDVMPFWTGDMIYIFASVKKEELLKLLGPAAEYAKKAIELKEKAQNLAAKVDEIVDDIAEEGIEGAAKNALKGQTGAAGEQMGISEGGASLAAPTNVIDLRNIASTKSSSDKTPIDDLPKAA